MHAAVLHTLGKPPRFESFPDPVAEPDEAIVHVRAASLKPIDRLMASGGHYASPREFPVVCGVDGIGVLDDGTRVFFGGPRRPYGAMAERTVVARSRCWPVPESLDDATAAALLNPALSSWLPLVWRAQLAAGETVLILGATGIAGKLAVRVAKLLGAGRVVAAGRNEQALSTLGGLGADAVIHLDASDQEVTQAFAREAGNKGYDVIVDYLWGHPTELLLAALTRAEFSMKAAGPRLIPIGESAGPAISLPAAALRSAGLAILGGGFPPMNILLDAYNQAMAHAASGELRIETERVPLEDVEKAWQRPAHGPRLVLTIAPGEATWTNERRAVRYKATGENTGRESEKRRYSIRERLWKHRPSPRIPSSTMSPPSTLSLAASSARPRSSVRSARPAAITPKSKSAIPCS